MTASANRQLTALWHRDYLSGLGDDTWGVLRLIEPFGLFERREVAGEVFERCLYIISQRAENLLITTQFIHKAWPNNIHTCLAGRGTEARQYSVGYFEGQKARAHTVFSYIYCAGPGRALESLVGTVARDGHTTGGEVALEAAGLVAASASRPQLHMNTSPILSSLQNHFRDDQRPTLPPSQATAHLAALSTDPARTSTLSYEDWILPSSSLTAQQRMILEGDFVLRQPLRLMGPAGTGKTLLMQLLAMRRLTEAERNHQTLRALYVAHSNAMAASVKQSLTTLGGARFLEASGQQQITVSTLSRYIEDASQIALVDSIGPDIEHNRAFQEERVREAIATVAAKPDQKSNLSKVASNPESATALARILTREIAVAIKGHGLVDDRRGYVEADRKLSDLHGNMTRPDREFIYAVYEDYARQLADVWQILDADDLALTLLGHLRTPLWQLKQRQGEGFDLIFVDEAQLFNDNERRLFPLLARGDAKHVPLVLALDQAQELHGAVLSGLGLLGIDSVKDVRLDQVHRSAQPILDLAFSLLQRTMALFQTEFPDFTSNSKGRKSRQDITRPVLVRVRDGDDLGAQVIGQIRALRRKNIWTIGLIVYGEHLWPTLHSAIEKSDLAPSLHVVAERGAKAEISSRWLSMGRPEFMGGQEFDGVVAVGIERGFVPPRIKLRNDALASALDEFALRELYLGFTRARDALVIVNSAGSQPSHLLDAAIQHGYIKEAEVHSARKKKSPSSKGRAR